MDKKDFKRINDFLWEVPKSLRQDMKVPARIYLSEKMLEEVFKDRSIEQLVNVATLPGVINFSIAMPDIHEGYGFPIGGVAAMDIRKGVISPGGVGYDINCLPSESLVSLSCGAYLQIKNLNNFKPPSFLSLLQKNNKKIKEAQFINFFSRYERNFLYSIKTKSGFRIKTTADHPLYASTGMKRAENLKIKEKVVIYPFSGIIFEEPSSKKLITEEKIISALKKLNLPNSGNRYPQIINWFKKREFIDITYNSWQMSYLIKILGYIFGDGTANFVGKNKKGLVSFYGKAEDLKQIRSDLQKIGIKSVFYRRHRKHKIKTNYGTYNFSVIENSLSVHSSGFLLLLYFLGCPLGNKTYQKFGIPKWLKKAPLWQKRLFLAAFFGAELSTPNTFNKYNFYAPTLNINKVKIFKKDGVRFLNDIRSSLKEFGIKSGKVVEIEGLSYPGQYGKTTGLRFQISDATDNLIKFFSTIGFEYNQRKRRLSCWAVGFLKYKKTIIKLRERIKETVKNLYCQGISARELVKNYKSNFVGKRFIEHSIWSQRGTPRVAFDFPSFEEYIKNHKYGDSGLIIDEIEEIKKEKYEGLVYDLTIKHPDHNFIADNFVVSNCGMRVLETNYLEKDLKPHIEKLATEIQKEVPSGLGRGRQLKLSNKEIDEILEGGAQFLVKKGYGGKEDVENCEAGGKLEWAETGDVSTHAKNRGKDQVGTLGSGNHFLEIQKVEEIFDEETAKVFGLFKDQIVIMIHTGSRGLGHQIATDYIKIMMQAIPKYGIYLPDRELAACPINSTEGQKYFSAMACGANYAWANRQMITHFVRKAWESALGNPMSQLNVLYDVAHNIAKKEKHIIDGKETELCVHRKGATRAFPPGHLEIPEKYREVGQPVLIPGSMGTASYILVGAASGEQAFYSTCHGAGRIMSRHEAMRRVSGQEVIKNLETKGIIVKCRSLRGIAEEAPLAYKNIDEVVDVVHNAGLSKKVAKLIPLAVIKGE